MTSMYTLNMKRLQNDFKERRKGMSVKTFTLRLTEEQLEFIGMKAAELGISKNDYIRRLIDGDIHADKQDQILQGILEIKRMIEKDV